MSKTSLQPTKIEQPLAGHRIKNSKGNNISSPSVCRDGNADPSYHPWESGTLHNFLNGGKIQCGRKSTYHCNLKTVKWIKGYRNTCPIAGCCGTFNRPAPLILHKFNFKQKNIEKKIKITEITLSYKHHITGVDVGVGKGSETKQWAGVFPKVHFTLYKNNTEIQTKTHNKNVPLAKNSTVSVTFGTNIDSFNPKTDDLRIKIDYEGNGGGSYSDKATNPSILYAKDLNIEMEYKELEVPKIASQSISVSGQSELITDPANPSSTAGPNGNNCRTTLTHTLSYQNTKPENVIVTVPDGVRYTKTVNHNNQTITFVYQDTSGKEGRKTITYALNSGSKQTIAKTYMAKLFVQPRFDVVKEYTKGQKFHPQDIFISVSNSCWISNEITIGGKDKHFFTLNKNNNNNPIDSATQQRFLEQINKLQCGEYTLYMKSEGESTAFPIVIKAPQITFSCNLKGEYDQNKHIHDEQYTPYYAPIPIVIKRTDNAELENPIEVKIIDSGTSAFPPQTVYLSPEEEVIHYINVYYPGTFEVKCTYNNGCSTETQNFGAYIVHPTHRQSYNKLILRSTNTDIIYDSIVIRKGDNQTKPVTYKYAILADSIDDITLFGKDGLCSIGELGYGILAIKNNRHENANTANTIQNVCIELNPLVESDTDDTYDALVMEWETGMLQNFKDNFYILNPQYRNIIDIYNIENKSLVNEGTENVVIKIKEIKAQEVVELKIPYSCSYEKEIYMNFLLLGEPSDFIDLDNTSLGLTTNKDFYQKNTYEDELYASHTSKYQERGCLCISLDVVDLLALDMKIEGDDLDRNDITNLDDLDISYKISLSNADIDCTNINDPIIVNTEIVNDAHLIPTGYQIGNNPKQNITLNFNEEFSQDGLTFFRGFSLNTQEMSGAEVFLRYKDQNNDIQYMRSLTDQEGIARFKYIIPEYYQTNEEINGSLSSKKTTYQLKDILNSVDIFYKGNDFYDSTFLEETIHNSLQETSIKIWGFVFYDTEKQAHFITIDNVTDDAISGENDIYIIGQLVNKSTGQGINEKIIYYHCGDTTSKDMTETNKYLLYGNNNIGKDGVFHIKINDSNESYNLQNIIRDCVVYYKEDLHYSGSSYPIFWEPETKPQPSIDYLDDYNTYRKGETIEIAVKLTTNEPKFKNTIDITHSLQSCNQTIHIFYQPCHQKNEKGFDTLFKTKSYNVIPNQVRETIYCLVDTDLRILARLEKKIIENHNVNVLTINAINGYKPNKNVLVKATIGPNSQDKLGDYLALTAVDIDKEKYSYDQSSDTIYWNIGDMDSYTTEICNILLEAENIGHNTIHVCGFDYLMPSSEMIIPTELTLELMDGEKEEYFVDDVVRVKAILKTSGTMQDVYGQIIFNATADDETTSISQAKISTFNNEHYGIGHIRLKKPTITTINASYAGEKIMSITYEGSKTENDLEFNVQKYQTNIKLRSNQESFSVNENIQIIGKITYPKLDDIEQYFDPKLNVKFFVENQALNNVTYSDNEYMINFKVTEAGEYTVKAFIPETYKTTESFDIMTINVTNGENNDG